MGRILVVVEGPTERAALQQPDVASQFVSLGFSLHPKVVGKPGHTGGVRSFDRVLPEIVALLRQEPLAKVTTLFDFYALPLSRWPGYPQSAALPAAQAVACIEAAMAGKVSEAIPDLMPGKFVPYVQLFEFEALLFADPAAMAQAFGNPSLEKNFADIVALAGAARQLMTVRPPRLPSELKLRFPLIRRVEA